jgi:hypothetical protein
MRKNALAMSIATLIGGMGFVGAASADVIPGTGAMTVTDATALQVNNGGVGHALITPYFSAQNGNATLISLVNTDSVNGKVVKVRFRGASNSDDILDFTVLMSPGDVWNATITAPSATAPAQIVTNDRTCTLPQLAAGVAQPFVTARLTSKGGNDIPNNTREGYVEIFNMADVPPSGTQTTNLFTTIKHSSAGVPTCNSGVINGAILTTNYSVGGGAGADETAARAAGLNTPTTGLFGDWAILNVPQTTTYSGQMVAIRATVGVGGADGRGNFVVFPQSASQYPGAANAVTADPLLAGGFATLSSTGGLGTAVPAPITAAFFDLPDMSTPYIGGVTPLVQAANLTASLAVKNVMNEYATDSIISGKTDWVFSMPTRRYSVAMNYVPSTSAPVFQNVNSPTPWFYSTNVSVNGTNSQQLCVAANAQTFFDREEQTKTSGAVFSPGNLSVTNFCGETSVLSFGDSGVSALGAAVARQDTGSSAFVNGWGNVDVNNLGRGLPILGSAFLKATNPSAGAGFAGTYGLSFEHRFTR